MHSVSQGCRCRQPCHVRFGPTVNAVASGSTHQLPKGVSGLYICTFEYIHVIDNLAVLLKLNHGTNTRVARVDGPQYYHRPSAVRLV